jgi:hypothetical protein
VTDFVAKDFIARFCSSRRERGLLIDPERTSAIYLSGDAQCAQIGKPIPRRPFPAYASWAMSSANGSV